MGQNLDKTVQLWFNDQRAGLIATYISSTSIIASVPTQIPRVVTNKMKLIFSNGDSLLYNFQVSINKPLISSMKCEYVADGGLATINGNYFYAPIKVYFPGVSAPATIDSIGDQIIKVIVPAGAQKGQVTMTSNFGSTKSDFWFRDDRNMFITSDPYEGWWNSDFVVSNPVTNDPPSINGSYFRVKKLVSSGTWMEAAGGPASTMLDFSKNIPDNAILHPELYNFKFEVNTVKPYNANLISFNVGLLVECDVPYAWPPPFDTKGEWRTVVIPYEVMWAAYKTKGVIPTVSPSGYWSRVLFFGSGDLDCDISFDNFRVVPKTITN